MTLQLVDGKFRDSRWQEGRWVLDSFKDVNGSMNWDQVPTYGYALLAVQSCQLCICQRAVTQCAALIVKSLHDRSSILVIAQQVFHFRSCINAPRIKALLHGDFCLSHGQACTLKFNGRACDCKGD